MGYQIRIREAHAMCFEPKVEMIDTWTGSVVWVDEHGKETQAISVGAFNRTALGKKRCTAKCNEQRRRLEHHLKTTGKRWEVERMAEEQAKADAKALKHNIAKTKRQYADELYDTLRHLVTLGEAEQLPTAKTIEEARALIELATYKKVASPIAAKTNHD